MLPGNKSSIGQPGKEFENRVIYIIQSLACYYLSGYLFTCFDTQMLKQLGGHGKVKVAKALVAYLIPLKDIGKAYAPCQLMAG